MKVIFFLICIVFFCSIFPSDFPYESDSNTSKTNRIQEAKNLCARALSKRDKARAVLDNTNTEWISAMAIFVKVQAEYERAMIELEEIKGSADEIEKTNVK